MQAIAEATGPGIKLLPQLRKENPQFLGVIRQIGAVEPGCISTLALGPRGNSSTWRVVWRPRCSRPDTAAVRS